MPVLNVISLHIWGYKSLDKNSALRVVNMTTSVLSQDFFIERFLHNTEKTCCSMFFARNNETQQYYFWWITFFICVPPRWLISFFHAIHSTTALPLLFERVFFSWRLTSSFFDAVWVYYWLFHLKTTFMTLSSHCPLHTFPFLVFCKVKLIRFMQQVSETETSS